jgi:hypothetical protein
MDDIGVTDSYFYSLRRLLTLLLERHSRVRDLILSFKNSSRNPFPNWSQATACITG